jgi:hypothetical protein
MTQFVGRKDYPRSGLHDSRHRRNSEPDARPVTRANRSTDVQYPTFPEIPMAIS